MHGNPRSQRYFNSSRGLDWHAVIVWAAPVAVSAVFIWIVGSILIHGLDHMSWSFLVDAPRRSGRQGGIGPILVSTCLILFVCLAVALPIAIGTAVLLAEFVSGVHAGGRLVRISLDILAGVPSIVFGIFGNAFFCQFLGLGFSILSGGLTLACMVLPVLIRTTEQSFRAVPNSYRLGAAALGFSKTRMIFKVLLPIAIPGIMVGTLLGTGRALAETAALIFTSGYVDRMPSSLLDSGRSLSIHIFDLSMNVSGGDASAYRSAVVLLVLLLSINGVVICMTSFWRRLVGLSAITA
jgi:phosphate transport system permease protein